MSSQNMKQMHSNSEKKHKSHKQLRFMTIIICVTICIIILLSIFIVTRQGVIQGTVTVTLISIVSGVVISLLGLLISFMQWHTSKADHAEDKPRQEVIQSNITNFSPVVNPAVKLESPSSNLSNSQSIQPEMAIVLDEVEVHAIEIPRLEAFYGRENETSTIYQWIDKYRCKMIAIVGMGGIGKTSLAVNIVENVKNIFDVVYWESLRDAPALSTILKKYILFLSEQHYTNFVDNIDGLIQVFLFYVSKKRCLFVFDNMESILQLGKGELQYLDGFEDYGKLLQLFGESRHQSCFLITSREKPRELALLEGDNLSVRSYQLSGLNIHEGKDVLKDKGLVGTENECNKLIDIYGGNPLALQLVSLFIREVFNGHINDFFADGDIIFSDIRDVLDKQFARLSTIEQEVMYWLAIEREAISIQGLLESWSLPIEKQSLQEAWRLLQRRYLVEVHSGGITLQNVVMEYITERFVREICEEIKAEKHQLLESHALTKAQAKDYIQESQVRFILAPIAAFVGKNMNKDDIEIHCKNILKSLRNQVVKLTGYGASNLLNLLLMLHHDLEQYDFSHLTVRQGYFQGKSLRHVNFAGSDLSTSVFTDTFGGILFVALSPDGTVLAAGTVNGEVRLWRLVDGTLLNIFSAHTGWVRSVVFSPDSKYLASAGEDQLINVWDVKELRHVHTLWGHTQHIRSLAFSPNQKFLASCSEDCSIRFWDIKDGKCIYIFEGHTRSVRAIAFKDDNTLLSVGLDNNIMNWDIHSGQSLTIPLKYSSHLKSTVFSYDRKWLVTGSDDCSIYLWDVENGQNVKRFEGHTKQVWSVYISKDNKILISGSEDTTIRVWEIESGQCIKTFIGHTRAVRTLLLTPDNYLLISGSEDQSIRIWNMASGQCIKTLLGTANWTGAIALSLDGHLLATGNEDHHVRVWNVESGQRIKTFVGHTQLVNTVAFHPNGQLVASGSADRTVRLWKMFDETFSKILIEHTNWVWSVAFSYNGLLLASVASGDDDKKVYLWDVDNWKVIKTFEGHRSTVRSLVFSPDSRFIAGGSADALVHIWDVASGQHLLSLTGHTNPLRSVVYSPDGQYLASGGEDHTINVWEINNSKRIHTFHGHTGWVWSVAFSPDNHFLASGGADHTIRIWDLMDSQCIKVLKGHTNWVKSVYFSPLGYLLSGSYDGTIKFWNVDTGECLRTLKDDRPYEGMNITAVRGLTATQKAIIKELGAFEDT